jgi:viroplasmin and RNaseH domain-containing protein
VYDPQEENSRKEIAFVVKGGKISAQILQKMLKSFLAEHAHRRSSSKNRQTARKLNPKCRQKLSQLGRDGGQLQTMELASENINEFDRSARKFGVGYSVRKDASKDPLEYIVIFKAKDTALMTEAFKDFTARKLVVHKKPSILAQLKNVAEKVRDGAQKVKKRLKKREEVL